eukprot:1315246-Pyramimonas_sp.AAC.1
MPSGMLASWADAAYVSEHEPEVEGPLAIHGGDGVEGSFEDADPDDLSAYCDVDDSGLGNDVPPECGGLDVPVDVPSEVLEYEPGGDSDASSVGDIIDALVAADALQLEGPGLDHDRDAALHSGA